MKKNVLNKDVSIDFFLEKLNYLGLECEKVSLEQNESLLINFLPVSNRKDLNSWLGIANEISSISEFSNGISSIIQWEDTSCLEKEKIGTDNFSLIILKNLEFKDKKNDLYLENFTLSESEEKESRLSNFFKLITLQTSYKIETFCLNSFFKDGKYVSIDICQNLKKNFLLKISKEDQSKSVSVLTEKDFLSFFFEQIKLLFKEPKINVHLLSKNFLIKDKEKVIEVDHYYLESRLGIKFSKQNILNIFKKLKFESSEKEGIYLVKIPFYRRDLLKKEDLLEEVGKSFDYNKISGVDFPSTNKLENSLFEKKRLLKEKVTSYFVNLGFYEVITYSLISNEMLVCEEKDFFKLLNPRSLNHEIYRRFIFPSHIELFKNMFGKGFDNIPVFEISKIYIKNENGQLVEKEKISLSFAVENNFLTKKNDNFNFIKKIFENLFSKIGVENHIFWKENKLSFLKEGLEINIKNKNVGFLGFLDDKLFKNKGFIEKDVICCEIELDIILETSINKKKEKAFVSFLKSPIIKKDLSFFVSKSFNENTIIFFIKDKLSENNLFVFNVELIDVYQNNLKDNQHSLCFRIEFSAQKTNLENNKINEKIERIFNSLEKEFKIVRR